MPSEKKVETQKTNSENFKNAICYIPFVGIILFFAENKKTHTLNKNIKYGTILFGLYVVINFFLGWLLPWGTLFIVYVGIAGFLGNKAYRGEKIELDYIDEMEKKVKEKL